MSTTQRGGPPALPDAAVPGRSFRWGLAVGVTVGLAIGLIAGEVFRAPSAADRAAEASLQQWERVKRITDAGADAALKQLLPSAEEMRRAEAAARAK